MDKSSSPGSPPDPRRDTFRTLRVRNFRLLFTGTVISQTGDFLQLMAQGWLVLILTGSPMFHEPSSIDDWLERCTQRDDAPLEQVLIAPGGAV